MRSINYYRTQIGEDFTEGCFTGAGLCGFTCSSLDIVAPGAEECGSMGTVV